MRDWLKELACKAATEMGAELKQMGAHGAHEAAALCSIKTPLSCTPEVLEKIRRSETSSTKLNTKSNEKCKPLCSLERP